MTRVLALTIPCLAALLSGCVEDEPYPAHIEYPLRSDPIVVDVPKSQPWDTSRPGQLDANIARFREGDLGGSTLDPNALSAKDRAEIEKALSAIFGKPAAPSVKLDDSEAKDVVKNLKLDDLEKGSKVYRRHCMHCHGVTGDGRGPTAPWINPHPRDYRLGLFKFISADSALGGARKPRRADIRRTLEHGIEGTSMPSFSLLEEDEKEALISYVIHLSLRGEAEQNTMKAILKKEDLGGSIRDKVAEETMTVLLGGWAKSNATGIEPAPYPYKKGDREQLAASIRRGFTTFTDPKGQGSCIKCHVDFGRQAPFRYDSWGSLVRPANLTAGVYRGGRRPIDLYWRISGGIPGAEMPKAEFEQGKDKSINPFWDVVNFLQALPYPQMLPEDVRDRIYAHREKTPAVHAQR